MRPSDGAYKGVLINRRASLQAQLVTLAEQRDRLAPVARSMSPRSEDARAQLTTIKQAMEAATAQLAHLAEPRAITEG